MAWITPVTHTSEGYYNYSDLNRVENNTDDVADLIEAFATRPVLGIVKTDWDNEDFVFYDDLNRIEGNLVIITNAIGTPIGFITPKTTWESLQVFSYVDANRLETDLLLLKNMIQTITDSFLYCGDFYCNEQTML